MSDHSRIAPSSASRWVECPGSVQMESGREGPESTSAKDGDAAHRAAAVTLTNWKGGTRPVLEDCGASLTDEMIGAARVYTADVIKEALFRGAFGTLLIEYKVAATQIHKESWGTVDCFMWDPLTRELIIWDFKSGYGIVEPFENWQLINYAAGVVALFDLPEGVLIRMRVAQPLPYHKEGSIREWAIRAVDLRPYFNTLSHSAHLALLPNPPIKSGPHCIYCQAMHDCPAGQKAAMAGVEYSDVAQTVNLPPGAIWPEIKVLRRVQGAVEYRLTALETQALSLIKQGVSINGCVAELGKGSVKWKSTVAEVVAVGARHNVNLQKAQAVITPNQAEKAGLPKEVVKKHSERTAGSLKLVKATDTIAAKAFKKET